MLRFEQVSLSYRVREEEPVVAVERVSAEVQPGEMVMVYGPSGSGKSTLLQLAAGLLRPDEGRVVVGGRDISTLKPRAAARYRMHELGFVTAFSSVMPAPAVENAALKLLGAGASWSQAQAQVTPLLERLGMGEKLARSGAHLSMGERQRVMIARALSNKPRLLLADEPTSNLDSHRSEEVLEVLREHCHDSGLAALIVTHDPQAAAAADRVHTLRDGQLLDHDPRASAIALQG